MDQLLRSSSHSALETAMRVYNREGLRGFWKVRAGVVLRCVVLCCVVLSCVVCVCVCMCACEGSVSLRCVHALGKGLAAPPCNKLPTWLVTSRQHISKLQTNTQHAQGNALNVARTAPFKALNFFSFDMYSRLLLAQLGSDVGSLRFLAGAAAGEAVVIKAVFV